jgi:hypothetical protein
MMFTQLVVGNPKYDLLSSNMLDSQYLKTFLCCLNMLLTL